MQLGYGPVQECNAARVRPSASSAARIQPSASSAARIWSSAGV